ncbi:hypothetical protein BDW59DRAFT_140371 [Aspergillus cavernicola]|uniref:Uncharacterized protein n=1 Tax=Aspergillus cavernicola TaxID=176166 RepID=A0ABR4IUZ9_9EURO
MTTPPPRSIDVYLRSNSLPTLSEPSPRPPAMHSSYSGVWSLDYCDARCLFFLARFWNFLLATEKNVMIF